MEDVSVRGNTFLFTGHGWGFEQHDHPGQAQIGADVFISTNQATTARISITDNLFHGSRAVLVADFHVDAPQSQALVRQLEMDDNR